MNKVAIIINVDWYFVLHWLERARAIRDSGYTVHVICKFTKHDNIDLLVQEGFKCDNINLSRKSLNPFKELKSVFEIISILRRISPCLVHGITIKPIIYGGLFCRLIGKPFIASVPGLGRLFNPNIRILRVAGWFVQPLYRFALSGKMSFVIFENKEDRALLVARKIVSQDRSQVISGAGVNLQEYSFSKIRLDHTPVLLFAARMIWDKGVKEYVEAVKILKAKGVALRAKIAGIIDLDAMNAVPESYLEKWHEEGVIEWLGQREDMAPLIASANIVVLPTRYNEGVPRVLIEAAACGRPTIATDIVGCRDIVRHRYNGVLVEKGNYEALSVAIEALINNPSLQVEYGENARKMVENGYSNEDVIKKTLKIYHEMTDFSRLSRSF